MKKIAIILSLIVSICAQKGPVLEFDGTDDYVDLGNISNTNFTTADFSIQAWVQTTSNKGQGIFVKSNGDNTLDAGEKSLFIEPAGYPWFGNGDEGYIPATGYTVNDGLWHHIVVTWDHAGTGTTGIGKIYVDGVDATYNNDYFVNTADNSEDKIYIGIPNYKASNAPNYFDGAIAEVAIWGYALSAAEVLALHSAYFSANLIGDRYEITTSAYYWKLNDGSASIYARDGNYSLSFDGVDDYVEIDNSLSYTTLTGLSAITLSGSFKRKSGTGWQGLWGNNQSNLTQISIRIDDQNYLSLGYKDVSGFYDYTLNDRTIDFDKWYNLSVVLNANKLLWYLDGDLIEEDNVSFTELSNYGANTPEFSIGRGNKTYGEYFNGIIDNVNLWNIALSSSSIKNYLNTPPISASSGLIASWVFNEGNGSTVSDQSGNGFIGTMHGNSDHSLYWSALCPPMSCYNGTIYGATWNTSPVIEEVGDVTINEDENTTITLSATDAEGEAITYGAVIDTNAVTFSISSSTLTLTPNANWNGIANCRVYAGDGSSWNSTSFKLTVAPVNDAPTAFDWVSSALDTINITQSNLTDTYTLRWDASTDAADGDSINYLVYAKVGVYPPEEIYDSTVTSVSITYQEILEGVFEGSPVNGATVSLNVKATDGIDTVDVTGDNRVIYVNRYEFLSTEGEGIPTKFALHENYPNPFNPTTTLRFDLPEASNITLTIYNMLGQRVRTFNMNDTPAGYHSIKWNATNNYGEEVGAGVYLYQLQTKDFVKTRKMVLLK